MGSEIIQIANSLGRVLAEEILCSTDLPPRDIALKDGYAVRIEDLKAGQTLSVVGHIGAGEEWGQGFKHGEALQVSTGAAVPSASELVLPKESVRLLRGTIQPRSGCQGTGTNIARRASAARKGERLLPAGERIDCDRLATIASTGVEDIRVRRRPDIGVLPTGSELIRPGEKPGAGQIYSSHGLYLCSLVRSEGGLCKINGLISDDERSLQEAIMKDQGKDLLITTGGTGPGDGDLISHVMARLDAKVVFRGIHMKPGKSTSLYGVGGCPVLALPGRFGAVRVVYAKLVSPALGYLQGFMGSGGREQACLAGRDLKRERHVHRFVDAKVWTQGCQLHAAPTDSMPGGRTKWHSGNGWIEIPPGEGMVAQGTPVRILLRNTGLPFQDRITAG